MTHFTQRNLRQAITYWAPVSGDVTNDFGHADTVSGVVIKGRWEENVQQIRKPSGEEAVSMAQVFVDRDVKIGGFLKLGEFDGETLEDDAQEIQDYRTSPDLRNLGTERRAFL